MKKIAFALTLVALCSLASARPQHFFHGDLSGQQEVPPNASPAFGDIDAELNGSPGSWVLTYSVSFQGLLAGMSDAHIHLGAAGANGPVRHFFDNRPLGSTSGTFSGDWRFNDGSNPLTDALANSIIAGGTYANIHTSVFPGGEIRGQILEIPEPGSLALLAGAGLLVLRRRA